MYRFREVTLHKHVGDAIKMLRKRNITFSQSFSSFTWSTWQNKEILFCNLWSLQHKVNIENKYKKTILRQPFKYVGLYLYAN